MDPAIGPAPGRNLFTSFHGHQVPGRPQVSQATARLPITWGVLRMGGVLGIGGVSLGSPSAQPFLPLSLLSPPQPILISLLLFLSHGFLNKTENWEDERGTDTLGCEQC